MPRPVLILLSLSWLPLAAPAWAQMPDNRKQDHDAPVKASTAVTGKSTLTASHFGATRPVAPPTLTAQAQPLAVDSPWGGGGELGFASARGNSTTESLNARLNLSYADGGSWKHSASLAGLRARSGYTSRQPDGTFKRERRNTANRYTLTGNSAYRMGARGTLNASLRHEEDDFGTFSQQSSLSASYGNRVIDDDRTQLDLQIGSGLRRAHDTRTERNQSGVIGRGLVDLRVSLSQNTELVNKLLVESGRYNTFAQNDLGVSVTMNSRLALKAGWQARHNSDVAGSLKRTDTLTTMNLVYTFK